MSNTQSYAILVIQETPKEVTDKETSCHRQVGNPRQSSPTNCQEPGTGTRTVPTTNNRSILIARVAARIHSQLKAQSHAMQAGSEQNTRQHVLAGRGLVVHSTVYSHIPY